MLGVEFKPWPKTPREKADNILVTEKMDGANVCIVVQGGEIVAVQSRNRFISPGKDTDNFGFAQWVSVNAKELAALGEGYHYGEWVGPGIQKNPHNLPEKRLYLFNVDREYGELPDRIELVPVLYRGPRSEAEITRAFEGLYDAAQFSDVRPEGIIIYSYLTKTRLKRTFAMTEGKWSAK